jgi:hypothetical protein
MVSKRKPSNSVPLVTPKLTAWEHRKQQMMLAACTKDDARILEQFLEATDAAIAENDAERAAWLASHLGRIAERNELLPILQFDANRKSGKRNQNQQVRFARQKNIDLAHKLWAEYAPRVKSKEIKSPTACKLIGEAIRRKLKLDFTPKWETVRDYLKEKTSGEP